MDINTVNQVIQSGVCQLQDLGQQKYQFEDLVLVVIHMHVIHACACLALLPQRWS